MNKIAVLDNHVANLIAAGEVVERPVSVVKELVENALDAKATSITLSIKEAGLSHIRVEDNGEGMSEADARLAFLRHATSKLKTPSDLQSIRSLGFRGEALPSIASVSHVVMQTAHGDESTQVEIDQGVMSVTSINPRPQGTTITITKLFVNTPARLKFLKHPTAETQAVVQFIQKLALARPDVAFRLLADDQDVVQTSGSGDLLKTASQVLGVAVAKALMPLDVGAYDLRIYGLVSNPTLSRSTRQHIHLMVNERVIHDVGLMQTIKDAYGHRYPVDRYPVAVLHIDIDPSFIDVNVSPTKLQVQFTNYYQLKSLLREAIQALIGDHVSIQEAIHPLSGEQIDMSFQEASATEPVTDVFPVLTFLTQVRNSYVIAQADDAMYVIDQHAAAERIRYEAYVDVMKHPPTAFQQLMMPLTLSLSSDELAKLGEISPQAVGFPFALRDDGIELTELPTWFREGLEEDYAAALVQQALRGRTASMIDDTARLLACKRSIKFNDVLSNAEAQSLLDQLSQCDDPYHCPHGRPTILRYSFSQLERMFGR
jgi:DNA mismatch repair protein MutL